MKNFAARSMKRARAKGLKLTFNCATARFSPNRSARERRRSRFSRRLSVNTLSKNRRRHSLRLPDYDYAQVGAYFVTIVTNQRICRFGNIIAGEMQLNPNGLQAQLVWSELPEHFKCVKTDAFVIMPNHVHGIIHITDPVGAQQAAPANGQVQPRSLGAIVRSFKSAVTKCYNEQHRDSEATLWQRNYYDHVIRDENALTRIREYITTNPARWSLDPENPFAAQPETKDLLLWINSGPPDARAQRAAPLHLKSR